MLNVNEENVRRNTYRRKMKNDSQEKCKGK